MASIKISNLPELSVSTLSDDDQFVVNDANQTTSRLGYGKFKENFLATNLTFAGTVSFSGDVTVTDSVTTNVATKTQVVTQIQVETDRALAAEAALGVRIDGIDTASIASNTVLAQKGVDDAAAAQADATAAIASAGDLGSQIGTVADAVTDPTINGKLNATGTGFNELKAAAATALAVFQTNGATDEQKLNATQSFFDTVQALTVA